MTQLIYSNTAFTLNLPKNYPSRTVFRFYNQTENGNNTALDFTSATFVLNVSGEEPIEFELTKKANLDFVLYIAANFLTLSTGIYDCAIYVDDDPVPFATGQAGVGNAMAPDQAIGVLNASRNAIKVDDAVLENPQFESSESVILEVVDNYDGSQSIIPQVDVEAAVLATELTGFAVGGYAEPVTDADNVLSAFEKLQDQIDALDAEVGDFQPLNSNLTQISAAVFAADNIVQKKAGVLVGRTPAQLKTDLALSKSDVGLSNVDNTSDANKPVSTAQATAIGVVQTDIDAHEADTANPHAVTKAQVGLANVPNVDATDAANISSGVLADARVQQSNVTQHQAALALAQSQITGLVSALAAKAAAGANTDITSVLLNQIGLVIKGATAVGLTIKPNETLSVARILNLILNDADRTLTIAADATVSGTNTGDQTSVSGNAGTATALATGRTISATGDATGTSAAFDGTAAASVPLTLATVNSNVGSFGSATQVPAITVNAKGLVTAVVNTAIAIAQSAVTNLVSDLAALSARFISTDQTITSAGSLSLAHGLGGAPVIVQAFLICQTGEFGYTAGDVLLSNLAMSDSGSDSYGVSIVATATNIDLRFGANANTFLALNKTTGAGAQLSNANWKLRIDAMR